MPSAPAIAPTAQPAADAAGIARLTRARLKELDRLRDVAFLHIEKLADACEKLPTERVLDALLANSGAQVMDFERLARSVRQIMVLEFELRGLFKAPDRDAPRKFRLVKSDRPGFEPPDLENFRLDLEGLEVGDFLDIRSDYRTGPLDQVVAGIRKTIGVEPPENDPFAPPPGRVVAPAKLPPATVILPQKPAAPEPSLTQREAAMKAMTIAIHAKGGDGFRKPGKSAKRRPSKHRSGRGPPR
ncbi:MAG TPA: hypothetical protein VH722_06190 [Alphaproteobacteria bacterium]|jgi:hypothetical protein|nr:hypothetical protein [Alphaproteobacteria bacterium]